MRRKRYKVKRKTTTFVVQGPEWSVSIEQEQAYPELALRLALLVKCARGQRWWCNSCGGIIEVDESNLGIGMSIGGTDPVVWVQCPTCEPGGAAATLDMRTLCDLMAATMTDCMIEIDGTVVALKRRNHEV